MERETRQPHVLDTLRQRGFIDQTTHDGELREYLEQGAASCYIGFDPTASSLHVGSLVPIMALAQMQRHGHRPIALVGGGTGLVGDPSGKTESRQMLTEEAVAHNAQGLREQLAHFLDFDHGRALMLNNADWLIGLQVIPFLRDIGRHFSVNRMIKAESYRMRLESEEGLSFIEFNYMLLQAYDFLTLAGRQRCHLQMGGSDQWGNIVAGIELIRKLRQEQAFGITFPLITTSSGAKMGKTAQGAVWLDPQRTSPYAYYQFWVNCEDADVVRFLALFTFLPMDEIGVVARLQGAERNAAKMVLAFEATLLAHGRQAALEALKAAERLFGARRIAGELLPSSTIPREGEGAGASSMPCSTISMAELRQGVPFFKLLHSAGLVASGGAGRRLISQGGAYLNGQRIDAQDYQVSQHDLSDGGLLLRSGKKKYHKIEVV
jgi:tyrosyl-tRNA synthetase